MSGAQVLKWFFKEQKSMVLLRDAYVAIKHRTRPFSNGLGREQSLEDFETYVNRWIQSSGLNGLINYIEYDYLCAIKKKLHYRNYDESCNKIMEKFVPLKKKWEYFTKHNVFTNSIQVGDKFNISLYYLSDKLEIEVTKVNLSRGEIRGNVNLHNTIREIGVFISNLKDKEGNSINCDFFIKRRGGVYNGANIL